MQLEPEHVGASQLIWGRIICHPVKVDSEHYKVEFENDQVRVLRVTYGPHEKSVMHAHPATVAVFLTDGQGKFTLPDGKTQEVPIKAGTSQWDGGGTHLPENTGDKPFELGRGGVEEQGGGREVAGRRGVPTMLAWGL